MNGIEPNNQNQSTAAWVVQSWVSFVVSVGVTIVGIACLISRIDEASVEKLLTDFNPLMPR